MKAATVFRCEHDINQLVTCYNIKTGFLQGDSNAHRFEIEVVDQGEPVDISNCSVLCDVLLDPMYKKGTVEVVGTKQGNTVVLV